MPAIITFTTDFGLREPYVAVMKGQALKRCPDVRIVDLSHGLDSYRPAEAGFWLARAAGWFPAGTVHVAVVDPGVGTARRLLAVAARQQLFLAPDNGLLAEIAGWPGARTRAIDLPGVAGAAGLGEVSATFHGRDVLAPLAAELAAGRVRFEQLGESCVALPGEALPPPVRSGMETAGQVAAIDKFGNIISNIDMSSPVDSSSWTVTIAGLKLAAVSAYLEAAPGSLVALVNSWGLAEVAEVEGDAARRLDVRRGDPVIVHRFTGC